MIERRTFAPLIRARQELQKRAERVVPFWRLAGDSPLPQPAIDLRPREREPLEPLAAAPLLEEAERVLRSDWRVFGVEASAFSRTRDWRAHPVSGVKTPLVHWTRLGLGEDQVGGDLKETWELNRHRELLRLAQAWFLTREERFLDSLGGALDAWIADNPPGYGINWCSSLEVALRAVSWCWLHALTADSALWTPGRSRSFAHALWHHGRHIAAYDSVHHSPNTHLTGEALGLIYLGTLYPSWPRARAWRRFGEFILLEELEHQVLADGFHYERAPGYHRYTVEFYLLWLALRAHANLAFPDRVVSAVIRMVESMLVVCRPDGLLPGIGDEDGGLTLPLHHAHPRDPAPTLSLAAELLQRPEWLGQLPPEARALGWWLLPVGPRMLAGRATAVAPSMVGASLPAAGYHVGRDEGFDGWWCLVDAGPHGGRQTGHAHTDLGHVEILHGHDPLVTDPGSYCYSGDSARRRWDRSEYAHAMLAVEEAPLAEPGGPFKWLRVAPDPVVRVTRDGGVFHCRLGYRWTAPGHGIIRHERQVVLWPGKGIMVVDWVDGVGERRVSVGWPLQVPVAAATLEASGLELPGRQVRIRWTGAGFDALTPSLEALEFASTYRTPVSGSVLRLGGRGEDGRVAATWFAATGSPLEARVVAGAVEAVSGTASPLVLRQELS